MQGTVTLYMTKYLNVICKCIIWSKRAAGQKGRSKRAHVKITNKRPFLTDLAIYYRGNHLMMALVRLVMNKSNN